MRTVLFAIACLAVGCNDYYLESKDPEAPPPLDADHCAQICDDWGLTLGLTGCNVQCGVTSYPSGTLIDGIVDFGVVDNGGNHCTMSATCPEDANSCDRDFALALTATEDIDGAWEELDKCRHDEECTDEYTTCVASADQEQQDCLAAGTSQTTCAAEHDYDVCMCASYQDICKDGEGLICEEPPPPAPMQTGPTTFTVPRAWLNFQLAHMAALRTSTMYWPVRGANSAWIGARLGEIKPTNPLYAVGIRSHDLLRSANGVSVIQAMRNPLLLQPLKTASVVSLTITRGGTQRVLTYNVH